MRPNDAEELVGHIHQVARREKSGRAPVEERF